MLLVACSHRTTVGAGDGPGAGAALSSHAFAASEETASAPLLYAAVPVPARPDGRPQIFEAADSLRAGSAFTLPMRAQLDAIRSRLRPRFRRHLAFLFDGPPGKQFFVVFLVGFPQYPVLNDCAPNRRCARMCPLYVDPNRYRTIPTTNPRCADHLPIWSR